MHKHNGLTSRRTGFENRERSTVRRGEPHSDVKLARGPVEPRRGIDWCGAPVK
jgi:hypothetical protein